LKFDVSYRPTVAYGFLVVWNRFEIIIPKWTICKHTISKSAI